MLKYLKHLLWLPVVVLMGVALSTSNYVLLVVAIAIVLGPLVLSNIRVLIYALVLSVALLEGLSTYVKILPRQITWLVDILCFLLLLRLVADFALGQIKLRNTFITYFVYAWLALAVIGIGANAVAAPEFLVGLRNYFRFIPLLFVFSLYPFPESFLKRLIKLVLVIGVIQLPIVAAERILFPGDYGDAIVGSFGANASGVLGLFEVVLLVILLALYKSRYYSGKDLMLYGVLVLLPSFITEAKIVFLLIPVLMIFYLFEMKSGRLGKNMMVAAVGAILFFGGVHVYNVIYAGQTQRRLQDVLLDPQRMMDFLGTDRSSYSGPGEMPRVTAVNHMFAHISKDPIMTVVGVGVGNASDSLFDASRGRYHKLYPKLRDDVFAARIGWEFGCAGLILFGVFFYKLARLRRHMDHDPFYNGLFYGVKGLVFIVVVSFIYNSFLALAPLAMLFWMLLGMVNGRVLVEKVSPMLVPGTSVRTDVDRERQAIDRRAARTRGSAVPCH
jgi:hypothetical protein